MQGREVPQTEKREVGSCCQISSWVRAGRAACFQGSPSPSRDPTLLCVPQLQVSQAGLAENSRHPRAPPSSPGYPWALQSSVHPPRRAPVSRTGSSRNHLPSLCLKGQDESCQDSGEVQSNPQTAERNQASGLWASTPRGCTQPSHHIVNLAQMSRWTSLSVTLSLRGPQPLPHPASPTISSSLLPHSPSGQEGPKDSKACTYS